MWREAQGSDTILSQCASHYNNSFPSLPVCVCVCEEGAAATHLPCPAQLPARSDVLTSPLTACNVSSVSPSKLSHTHTQYKARGGCGKSGNGLAGRRGKLCVCVLLDSSTNIPRRQQIAALCAHTHFLLTPLPNFYSLTSEEHGSTALLTANYRPFLVLGVDTEVSVYNV